MDCLDPVADGDQDCQDKEGNPCNPVTGNKSYSVTDYSVDGLTFKRTYHSTQGRTLHSHLGRGWSHGYGGFITQDGSQLNLITDRGRYHPFLDSGNGLYLSTLSDSLAIEDLGAQWVVKRGSRKEYYDQATGLLASIEYPDDAARNITITRDGQDRVSLVENAKGRLISFTYSSGQLAWITTPDGVISFSYSATGFGDMNLDGVTYPDSETETYAYDTRSNQSLLTQVNDQTGAAKGLYTYDDKGRVTGSHPGTGITGHTLEYLGPAQTVVTRPLGETVEYNAVSADGWFGAVTGSRLGTIPETLTYEDDTFFRVDSLDRAGQVTEYDYDNLKRESLRREAAGTADERVITSTWNDSHFRKASVTHESLETTYTYSTAGRVTEVERTDLDTSEVRTTIMTYCTSVDLSQGCPLVGLMRTVTHPGGGITDYDYYLGDDPGGDYATGDVKIITNPLGHTTEYLEYDSAGRPVRIRDANGVDTVMIYHARGWLLTRSIGSATTTFSYLPNGLVSRVTQPDGTYLDFEYDVAQRLEAIENALGERIEYELDAAGNRTAERILDASDTLRHEISRVYDQLGRLDAMINGLGHQTDYDYDAASNLSDVTDPLNNSTEHDYDPLNRLEKTLDALGGETEFDYDVRDNLTEVTDAEGLSTSYSYNAFGDLLELDSPDTGVTTYTYDSAGNRTSQTDARGVITTFTYDALNRLISAQYPDPGQNVSYFYDEANAVTGCSSSYPIGRLTRLVDESGTTTWCYDELGNVLEKSQSNASLSVGYTYNAAGRVQSITLPSGRSINYVRDADGNISSVFVASSSQGMQIPFITSIERAPFGPVENIQYASGRTLSFTLDAGYQVTGVSGDAVDLSFERDPVGNIVELQDSALQSAVEQYDYDNLYRLEEVADGVGGVIESYSYDLIGNRQQKQSSAGLQTYTYPLDSHRLIQVGSASRTYDAMGNMLSRRSGRDVLTYDQRGRLVQYSGSGKTASYTLNGLGQRVGKFVQSSTQQQQTYFVYDESGRLLSEHRAAQIGTGIHPWRDYIWIDDRLVGAIDILGYFHEIHTDHLGTPRAVVTSANGTLRWTWQFDQNPFGEALPNEDPESTGGPFELNLRFPGQYYDSESGLHYNYFRDYEPGVGRYVQSDPIGLDGGLSTYGYSNSNALLNLDVFGLAYFAFRPLEGSHSKPVCSYTFGNMFNLKFAHEQLFFEDGKQPSNLGFFADSEVRPDSPENLSKYRCRRGNYDDCIMREVVKRVPGGEYCLLGKWGVPKNNCQNWAQRVREEYDRAEHDSSILEKCECD